MNGTGLFGSTILDVALGLVFVYLLLAIMCTTVNEWVASLFKIRSQMLEKGIRQLLDAQPGAIESGVNGFLTEFYRHPLIDGLKNRGANPAYVPARTFSTAL